MNDSMPLPGGRSDRSLRPASVSGLVRFFSGLVQRSFGELWIWDREIADYVVDLLVRFARTDALYRVRSLQGRRLEQVVELLMEASGTADLPSVGPLREREVRQHIGDYTLFMSGIFRAYVERHGFLGFYLREGEKAYRETAKLDRRLYRPGAVRFETLASEFERVSGALDYMQKVYFRPAAQQGGFPDLLQRFDRWV